MKKRKRRTGWPHSLERIWCCFALHLSYRDWGNRRFTVFASFLTAEKTFRTGGANAPNAIASESNTPASVTALPVAAETGQRHTRSIRRDSKPHIPVLKITASGIPREAQNDRHRHRKTSR